MKARATKVLAFPVAPKFPPVPAKGASFIEKVEWLAIMHPSIVDTMERQVEMVLRTFRKMERTGVPLDRYQEYKHREWERERLARERAEAEDES